MASCCHPPPSVTRPSPSPVLRANDPICRGRGREEGGREGVREAGWGNAGGGEETRHFRLLLAALRSADVVRSGDTHILLSLLTFRFFFFFFLHDILFGLSKCYCCHFGVVNLFFKVVLTSPPIRSGLLWGDAVKVWCWIDYSLER